eukprot:COSAG02_NODE_258_length_26815_cov_12.034998_8_plen_91_part_00
MTEGSSKHSAQIRIDLFPQMRAGWRGSWGKMGGAGGEGGGDSPSGPAHLLLGRVLARRSCAGAAASTRCRRSRQGSELGIHYQNSKTGVS